MHVCTCTLHDPSFISFSYLKWGTKSQINVFQKKSLKCCNFKSSWILVKLTFMYMTVLQWTCTYMIYNIKPAPVPCYSIPCVAADAYRTFFGAVMCNTLFFMCHLCILQISTFTPFFKVNATRPWGTMSRRVLWDLSSWNTKPFQSTIHVCKCPFMTFYVCTCTVYRYAYIKYIRPRFMYFMLNVLCLFSSFFQFVIFDGSYYI